ncbi:hypothetical protein EHQ53_06740 [Leptospira langatensis]|uniref:Uncharacterized protein n=1 Tax=Leptospira langatensis TaxID=2484983 RepID=A0A5F1ZUG0_9LEPT|nr:hypothetical protein [Leptospira langatensis]TGK03139.1 hypothetical protein EHO57_07570 [Leptospira langatensis]TGL41896.1 hypothetical protein EHQ53_06740 [Leptospira langatensis]
MNFFYKRFAIFSKIAIGIFFCILFSSSLLSQEGSQAQKKEGQESKVASTTSNPNSDPKSRAYSLRKKSWISLRYLRTSLLNFGKKADWDSYLSDYSKAESSFQRGEWDSAGNQFQALKTKLDQSAEAQAKDVFSRSEALEKDIQPKVVDMKLDTDAPGRQYIPVMEKHLQIYRDTWLAAKLERENGNQGQNLYLAKQGLLQLYKAKILLEKAKEGKLESEEKLSKNKVLETDYLSPEEVKYWDDCLEVIHDQEEKNRAKEKQAIRNVYQDRKGKRPGEAKGQPDSSKSSSTEDGKK